MDSRQSEGGHIPEKRGDPLSLASKYTYQNPRSSSKAPDFPIDPDKYLKTKMKCKLFDAVWYSDAPMGKNP